MALLEQTVYVSVKNNAIEPRLYMVQSDTGRLIRCIVQDWNIPEGATAKIYVRKPSGKVVYNSCEIDTASNSVLISVTNQMIAEAGADNLAMVEITYDGECVTAFAFFLVVKYKIGGGEESKNESDWIEEILQRYIDEAEDLVKDAESAVEGIEESAKAAGEAAQSAADSARQAADSCDFVLDAAERAEKAAENAEASETNAAESSRQAVESADTVLAESEKTDERLDRAEGLIDATLEAAESAAQSASEAGESADDARTQAELAKEYAEDASRYSAIDISDKEVIFEEAADRGELRSGDILSVIIGKIKKWLSDLKPVAFSGSYTDLGDTENIQIKTGDASENTVTFEEASAAEELKSGDTLSILFGGIKKWLSDLKSASDDAMPKSGGTFTGTVTLAGDPTETLEAATKQYVDLNAKGSGTSVSAVLLASGWSEPEPSAQAIAVEGLTAETAGVIGLGHGLSYEEYMEGTLAGLAVQDQSDGMITIISYGDTPDIDIPVEILLLG